MKRLQQAATDDAMTNRFFDVMAGDSQGTRRFPGSNEFIGYKRLYVIDYLSRLLGLTFLLLVMCRIARRG